MREPVPRDRAIEINQDIGIAWTMLSRDPHTHTIDEIDKFEDSFRFMFATVRRLNEDVRARERKKLTEADDGFAEE